ncbi:MAG: response regulator [bacterium]|nr:response regulator [bacterium]
MNEMEDNIKPIKILLAEDNKSDIYIIKRAMKKMKFLKILKTVQNGREALDFLSRSGSYTGTNAPAPGMIFLDISMPVLDGFQTLKELKENPLFKKIPVVMLTTSRRHEDIQKSYEYGACSFLTKNIDFEVFCDSFELFERYWTVVSNVPQD